MNPINWFWQVNFKLTDHNEVQHTRGKFKAINLWQFLFASFSELSDRLLLVAYGGGGGGGGRGGGKGVLDDFHDVTIKLPDPPQGWSVILFFFETHFRKYFSGMHNL